jgi:2,3-bisphosphoglycerate-independent phosphoglycerate mutase
MLVAVDHPTPCTTKGHSSVPPLFAYAGTGIAAVEKVPFTEAATERGGYWIREGHKLMEAFLRG